MCLNADISDLLKAILSHELINNSDNLRLLVTLSKFTKGDNSFKCSVPEASIFAFCCPVSNIGYETVCY